MHLDENLRKSSSTLPRRARALGAILASAALALGCDGGDDVLLSPELREIVEAPEYAEARWGLYVADLETGEVIYSLRPEERFRTGSTAKIFSVTAALATLGPDHVFVTPVVHTGTLVDGTLDGDLVLRASGDLTLGGRRRPDGTLEVPDFDHTDANVLPGLATLNPQDPLAGLDALAEQIAAAGVTHVAGDVVVDDRLWERVVLDGVPISPISVNDNLLDFLITPGAEGEPATFTWRPMTAAYTPTIEVTTGAAGSDFDLEVVDDGAGGLTLQGSVPADATAPVVFTYQAPEPGAFARTLFIEALVRAGVTVDASPLGPNPVATLPEASVLDDATTLASLTSPPFSEHARLINKVSHNFGANQLPLILAANAGLRTHEEGLAIERAFLTQAGVDPALVTITDGQGLGGNTVAPAAMAQLLRYLSDQPYFDVFYASTPVLGVDGSLATVIPPDDPAVGQAHAKTGTLVALDPDSGRILMQTKALAGYLDAASGRRLVFAIFINDLPIERVDDVLRANETIGHMASLIFRAN